MVLIVRPAHATDAAACVEILNAIIRTGGTTAIETPLTADEITDWFLESDTVICCHVAEYNGVVAGFQSVGCGSDLPDDWGDMASFAAEGMTGKGIGSALFAATRLAARTAGLSGLNATIRADNDSGLRYYNRMGFKDYDLIPAVPLANGRRVDRICKKYLL
jgi:L-amino acid N-acyltransferase YncA